MALIHFYEKPGCINNTKQKDILVKAGHEVISVNILLVEWTKDNLLQFVQNKTATQMMNHTAPVIKSREIIPETLDLNQAIQLMIEDPILIRRPLIAVDNLFIQGFDDERLKPYIGDWNGEEDVITCPNLKTISCDDTAKPKS